MASVEIKALHQSDAVALAPLIAAYAQQIRRGAPRRPDKFYAEKLTADRTAEVLGAFADGQLVGFAVFFDLPDPITGYRQGQLSDLFVEPDHRGRGIGRELVGALVAEGQTRGWAALRWLVSERNEGGVAFSRSLGQPSRAHAFEITIDRLANGGL